MAMRRVERCEGIPNATHIPMNTMHHGEVCYYEERKHYVLCVSHCGQSPIYLILDNDDSTNSYGEGCEVFVRRLFPGESVTIEFS